MSYISIPNQLFLLLLGVFGIVFVYFFGNGGEGFVGQDTENTLTHTETDRETDRARERERDRQTESERDMNVEWWTWYAIEYNIKGYK